MKEPKKLDLYISFIKECLRRETSDGERWKALDWEDFFLFTQKQAVSGFVFEHIKRYKRDAIGITEEVLLNWYCLYKDIINRNQLINKQSLEIVRMFKAAGFRSCILKGQGNALMYPNPLSRMSGDIDLWVDANKEDIIRYVKSINSKAKVREKHISFETSPGIVVEVHYIPSTLRVPRYNKRLQTYYKEHSEEQFENVTEFFGNGRELCVPTVGFNAIQQLTHIMSHFFVEGVGLRQLIDYYFVLCNLESDNVNRDIWEKKLDRLGMLRFAKGVMWVEKYCLGLDDKFLLVEPNERVGRLIANEILQGGNFGYHDERYTFRKLGYVARGLTDIVRLLRMLPYFPEDALWKIYWKFENQKWKLKDC